MAANLAGMAFIPYYDHMISLLKTNPELHKTAKGIFKQVAWGTGGALLGGAVGGPLGATVGGIAGYLVSYRMTDDYQSLIEVLQDLSEEEKKELVEKVQTLIGSSSIEALTRFIGVQAQRSSLINLLRIATEGLNKGG